MTLAESAPLRGTAIALVFALLAGGAVAAVAAPVFHHHHRHGHYGHGRGHAPRVGPRLRCLRDNTVVVPRALR